MALILCESYLLYMPLNRSKNRGKIDSNIAL